MVLSDAAEALGGADEPILALGRLGILSGVLWVQSGVSFVVWIVAGLWFGRYLAAKATKSTGRKVSAVAGPASLIGGLAVLVVGSLAATATGGINGGSMAPSAWALVTLTGVGFTTMQTFGALCMLSASRPRETIVPDQASETPEK